MNRMEGLLAGHCPDGIEFKALGEAGELIRGRRFTKADYVDDGLGSIHYGEVYTTYGTVTNKVHQFVRSELRETLRLARPGDLVIAATGENVEEVGKAVAWLGPEEVAVHDDCYIFRHNLDPTYVSYFFQSSTFQDQKTQLVTDSKLARISGRNLAKIKIPVPPAEVQRKIASILVKMEALQAKLEAELQAELRARSLQYEFYRDQLLDFRESAGVHWAPMGELGLIFGGLTGKSKADFSDGNARFVSYVNVFNNMTVDLTAEDSVLVAPGERQRALRRGDILFTGSSESAADVAMSSVVTDEPVGPLYLNSFCIGFRPIGTSGLTPEFSKHLFRSSPMRAELVRTANGVTRFNVSKVRLAKISVPIPPTEEQHRIARILDRFNRLASDLSISLPAEIAARRQQYGCYRDKLLTFPERPDAA